MQVCAYDAEVRLWRLLPDMNSAHPASLHRQRKRLRIGKRLLRGLWRQRRNRFQKRKGTTMNFRAVDSLHTTLANMLASRVCRQSFLIVSLAVGVAGSLLQAQVPSAGGEMASPIPGVGHHYLGMSSDLLTETVNPATGSVSVSINLPTPPSRGFTLPFSIMYN